MGFIEKKILTQNCQKNKYRTYNSLLYVILLLGVSLETKSSIQVSEGKIQLVIKSRTHMGRLYSYIPILIRSSEMRMREYYGVFTVLTSTNRILVGNIHNCCANSSTLPFASSIPRTMTLKEPAKHYDFQNRRGKTGTRTIRSPTSEELEN